MPKITVAGGPSGGPDVAPLVVAAPSDPPEVDRPDTDKPAPDKPKPTRRPQTRRKS